IYYHRGILYQRQQKNDPALQDYSQAIRLNSYARAETYNNRGTLYIMEGLYQDALNDFDRALERNPDFVPARMNREQVMKDMMKNK
ncbi:MAG: tetratricopeptide repeat protein, partial [Candidatus Omnitrophica bacterium]|nr:tetratricopeptide repeat protein [Candidatus Omnitrophota bacterium]